MGRAPNPLAGVTMPVLPRVAVFMVSSLVLRKIAVRCAETATRCTGSLTFSLRYKDKPDQGENDRENESACDIVGKMDAADNAAEADDNAGD